MGQACRHVVRAKRRPPGYYLLQEGHRRGRQVYQIPLAEVQSTGTGGREDQSTAWLQETPKWYLLNTFNRQDRWHKSPFFHPKKCTNRTNQAKSYITQL